MRILIADDHPIVRAGWEQTLGQVHQIVCSCVDGQQALQGWLQHRPELGLIDLRMPGLDGCSAIAAIQSADPQARLVAVTSFGTEEDVYQAIRSGARGFLLKDSPLDVIHDCLLKVAAGERFYPERVMSKLSTRLTRPEPTPRETEVLKLLAEGLSNKQISDRLGLSVETIKDHVKSLLQKLEAQTRTAAVHRARLQGLLPPPF
ncbi:response regulator transcription factor [bacterium]|nr:response regulator transcription factor [bacterium]